MPPIKRLCRVPLVVGVVLSLCGCFGLNPSFPVVWPPPHAKSNIESSIEGTYSCGDSKVKPAEASKRSPEQSPSIGKFLLGGDPPPLCEYFEIRRVSEHEFEIRFLSQEREVLKKSYVRDRDFHVEDGWIRFAAVSDEWIFAPDLTGYYWKTPHITFDNNRDLIGKETNSVMGTMLFIFPVGFSENNWFKFARIR
jgi:hypothetical protein